MSLTCTDGPQFRTGAVFVLQQGVACVSVVTLCSGAGAGPGAELMPRSGRDGVMLAEMRAAARQPGPAGGNWVRRAATMVAPGLPGERDSHQPQCAVATVASPVRTIILANTR